MQWIKRYISIMLAVLFLTASTGLYIIEHYCDSCGIEESSLASSHHGHDQPASDCTDNCHHNSHHHSHEQCDIQFFKVDEPFLVSEKVQIDNPIAQTYDFSKLSEHSINQSIHVIPSQVVETSMDMPLIYLNCQLLI